ncbi:MipA/OmpV family protein [Pseudoalteromonas arctica]|uniref:MipA/OmpV family protein n=1 Tax=Pseudoalteromonas arctica TaxID=394751 RepID=A0A7Y0DSF9_9GAMM|nr:MipA/OmpV family protein [Pseudoalteromonas arctica]NMM40783.1 MipA/OmpV family protein [Pseudoalteromonas arctica]
MKLIVNFLTVLCISVLLTTPCFAKQSEEPSQGIIPGQWHLSLNLGLGVMSNPLNGGDNLPLVVIPDVAYYGEQFFFDNGRLGYSLVQDTPHIFNLVSELNPETRFFVDWHPSNLFALTSANSLLTSNSELNKQQQPQLNIDQLDKRKWALDAGLSYHYVFEQHVFSVQALADVSGVYEGWRSALQWQMHNEIGELQIKPSIGIWYKSAALNTYFYGITEKESPNGAVEIGSSWQPYAKIDARWPLNEANYLRFYVAYYDYSALDDSPLFEQTYSMTAFIGFDHIF